MSVTIAICASGWLLGWWAFGRVHFLGEASDRPSGRGVSIVIPARNEALSLPNLLSDLTEHRPLNCRVIVVDDHSTDGTGALAASFDFVEVIESPPLPDGWTGKSWACHTGASAATGEVLVFLDADVRVTAGSIDRLLNEVAARGGLVSVQPWHRTERPYEQCSALFNTIAVMGAGAGARRGPSGAFGPVLATTLDDYRAAGGHESVRTEVVEDLALARRYRDTAQPVHVMLGGRSIRFRMYPAGIRQLAEGWTKNFASGASSTGPARLAAVFLWITALGSSSITLVDAARGNVPLAVALAIYALFVVQLVVVFRLVGRFGVLTALCYPALFVVFCGIFVRSLWRTHVRRSVQWRDRQIALGPARS